MTFANRSRRAAARPRPARAAMLAGILLTDLVLVGAPRAFAAGASVEEEVAPPTAVSKVRVVTPDGKEEVPAAPTSDVERYCSAISDPARETRVALQTKRLQDLEAQVGRKVDELEAKRREYQDWLEQRRAFIESTSTIMLDIYAKMKPDAAASQLAGIERPTAASILARLKSRQASDILAEMPTEVAAEITKLIVEKTDKPMPAVASKQGSST